MTLLGNRVSKEVLKCSPRVDPNSVWLYPYTRGNLYTCVCAHTHCHHRRHMKMKAEIRMMLLQFKEGQRLPANYQRGEASKRSFLAAIRKNQPCQHLNPRLVAVQTSVILKQWIYYVSHSVHMETLENEYRSQLPNYYFQLKTLF